MELEFHQLDRRYEALRASSPSRQQRVLASLARYGQQLPVVVVASAERDGHYVLVDGYKRVRALEQLRQDTVVATAWDLREDEALLLGRLMQTSEPDSALEQAWLLDELSTRFGLTHEELARRFDRSTSWVSRRLGLVRALPEPIQQLVREGRLVAHAAMKCLLPLARANRHGAIALATAIAPLRPSTRQTEALCVAFSRAGVEGRQYLLTHAEQVLRTREQAPSELPPSDGEQLGRDLGALGAIARRARGRVAGGAVRELLPPERDELGGRLDAVRRDTQRLFTHLDQELDHARRAAQDGDSATS